MATFSKGREKGRYPSDEMLGSKFWKGSRMKDTFTMSLGGSWFYVGVVSMVGVDIFGQYIW